MRRIVLGMCTSLSLALVAAAASAAEPAFYECAKAIGGKYKDGKCTVEGGKGGHELIEGTGKAKPLKGTLADIETFIPAIAAPGDLSCKRIKFAGSLASPTTMKDVLITMIGCEETMREFVCTSAGQKRGTIVTNPMEGTLGYIDAPEHRVGVDFAAEGGGLMFDYHCEGLEWKIGGSWIGEIAPLGALGGSYSIAFERDAEGFQAIKRFEGGPEDVPVYTLNGGGPFGGSIAATVNFKGPKLLLKG
jgi:hypothetical protein